MKHKTAELVGALLDAAVAKCEGRSGYFCSGAKRFMHGRPGELIDVTSIDDRAPYAFSADWRVAGPIIERERIWTGYCDHDSAWPGQWFAQYGENYPDNHHMVGPTLLVAAMRAYVKSRFGDEVELP